MSCRYSSLSWYGFWRLWLLPNVSSVVVHHASQWDRDYVLPCVAARSQDLSLQIANHRDIQGPSSLCSWPTLPYNPYTSYKPYKPCKPYKLISSHVGNWP